MNNLVLELFLVIVGLIFTTFLLRYTFSSDTKSKKAFLASDGTRFATQKDCDEYDYLLKRLGCLYEQEQTSNPRRNKKTLGMNSLFINKIKSEGFSDLKTLISFKNDFKKLVDLLDCELNKEETPDN